ncbi:hypothetical protein [[Kitasatospora] papulosa]|uniref:hypothetical protein n=1 Tax=[Kitasatospora] papulosa TaxID=1464011 RepID=UPI0038575ABD
MSDSAREKALQMMTMPWQDQEVPPAVTAACTLILDLVEQEHAATLAKQQKAWALERQEELAGNAWDKVHDVIAVIEPKTESPEDWLR